VTGTGGQWTSAAVTPSAASGNLGVGVIGWVDGVTRALARPHGGFVEAFQICRPGLYRFTFEVDVDISYLIDTEVFSADLPGVGRVTRAIGAGLLGSAGGTAAFLGQHWIRGSGVNAAGAQVILEPQRTAHALVDAQALRADGSVQETVIWSQDVELPSAWIYNWFAGVQPSLSLTSILGARSEGFITGAAELVRVTISWEDDAGPATRLGGGGAAGAPGEDNAVGCWELEHEGTLDNRITLAGLGEFTLLDAVSRAQADFQVSEDGMVTGTGSGTVTGTHGALLFEDNGQVHCQESGPLDVAFTFALAGHAQDGTFDLEADELEITEGSVLDCMGGLLGNAVMEAILDLLLASSMPAENGAKHEGELKGSELVTGEGGQVLGSREMDLRWTNTVWRLDCPGPGGVPAEGQGFGGTNGPVC
jgi:hypothetical protein